MTSFVLLAMRNIRSIAYIVRRELIGERILYNGALVAVTLLFFSLLASKLSFAHPERILMTLGLGVVRLGLIGTALLLAAIIIPREYGRRTAMMILSRPVSGLEFALGMYLGMASVIAVNWLVLSGLLVVALTLFNTQLSGILVFALAGGLLEALIMAAIAMAFSVYSSPAVSVSISVGIFIAGSSFSQLKFLASGSEGPVSVLLDAALVLIPNLERFQLTQNLIYMIPLTISYILGVILYALAWLIIALMATGALVSWRKA